MAEEKNEIIKEATAEYEYLTGDENLKRIAFLKRKYELDYNTGMYNAERRGIIKIAKNMLKNGMSIKEIAKITELSQEEILKLK